MSQKYKDLSSNLENAQTTLEEMSILDSPERLYAPLRPSNKSIGIGTVAIKSQRPDITGMAGVGTSSKERSIIWEERMKNKWDRIVGTAVHRKWKSYFDSGKGTIFQNEERQEGLKEFMAHLWPIRRKNNSLPVESIISLYHALENGKFWFPAQVYNRENNTEYMLSSYDAELLYDQRTNTFHARYPPYEASGIETGVTWDRIRAPPIDISPHHLHISDCLNQLHPGDHIEVQWRRTKEFLFGWWYGVVAHLETCEGNPRYCRCHENDTVVLEFCHFEPDSDWRRMLIKRKDHSEDGNETKGFYGGIRKLSNSEEITMWKKHWITDILS